MPVPLTRAFHRMERLACKPFFLTGPFGTEPKVPLPNGCCVHSKAVTSGGHLKYYCYKNWQPTGKRYLHSTHAFISLMFLTKI